MNVTEALHGARQLPESFSYFPLGYSVRASSILVSGSEVPRPLGIYKEKATGGAAGAGEGKGGKGGEVKFAPSRAIDYELEMAAIVGRPSKYGVPVGFDQAEEHIFGFVLLNDWSGESVPLLLYFLPASPFHLLSSGKTKTQCSAS